MQVNKKIYFFAFSLILCVALLAYLLTQPNKDHTAHQGFQIAEKNTQEKLNQTISGKKIEYPPDSIPRFGENLAKTLPELLVASEAGNYRATCRLASSIRRCELRSELFGKLGELTGELKKYQKQLSAGSESVDPIIQAKIAERQRDEANWASMCDGFTAPMAKPAWHYQYLASMQGHIPSMVDFAFAPAMADYGIFNIFNSADKVGWDFYEHNAGLFLRQAADSGNLRAISLLTSALMGRKNIGERGVLLVQPDKNEAAKYAFVYRAIASAKDVQSMEKRTLPELQKLLTSEERASAEIEAGVILNSISKEYINRQLTQTESRYGQGDRCADN